MIGFLFISSSIFQLKRIDALCDGPQDLEKREGLFFFFVAIFQLPQQQIAETAPGIFRTIELFTAVLQLRGVT